MRKVRSRNFILIVCGILIVLLLGVVIAKSIVTVIDEVNNKDKGEELQRNVLSYSSKIKLFGKGNFIDGTPQINKTMISNYNVKLSNKNDEVYYAISFCNMNNEDLKYEKLIVEAVSCVDNLGIDTCSNVEVDNYVMKKKGKLEEGAVFAANSCVDVVIDVKYIADTSLDTEVMISRVVLELGEVKR